MVNKIVYVGVGTMKSEREGDGGGGGWTQQQHQLEGKRGGEEQTRLKEKNFVFIDDIIHDLVLM